MVDRRETFKKIVRAIKSVVLSLFYMDYQTDRYIEVQIEKEKHKAKVLSKFKLSFIVLTIATIIWMMTFFTLQKYISVSISVGILLCAGWLGLFVVFCLNAPHQKH